MKKLMMTILILFPLFGVAQLDLDSSTPEQCIESFFKAFHAQDTSAMKEIIHKDIVLATISSSLTDTVLVVDDIQKFYNSIASIPESVKFHEELTGIEVQTDGILAHVWTNYTFHLNEKVSHRGINAFTLMNENGTWKIIYLVDTRRKG